MHIIAYDYINKTMTLTMPKLLAATIAEFLTAEMPAAKTPMSESFNDTDQDEAQK